MKLAMRLRKNIELVNQRNASGELSDVQRSAIITMTKSAAVKLSTI
jgi:hypothetical protein